jgi:hypothetical protein
VADGDLVRTILEESERRQDLVLDCGGPAPGCSLYGLMFDVQIASAAAAATSTIAITALQIYASQPGCTYDLYVAQGTWRSVASRCDEIGLGFSVSGVGCRVPLVVCRFVGDGLM